MMVWRIEERFKGGTVPGRWTTFTVDLEDRYSRANAIEPEMYYEQSREAVDTVKILRDMHKDLEFRVTEHVLLPGTVIPS